MKNQSHSAGKKDRKRSLPHAKSNPIRTLLLAASTISAVQRPSHTSSLLLHLLGPLGRTSGSLLFLLLLTTLVEVLDHNTNEHVQHKEADQQQEADEEEKTPLAVVHLGLSNKEV